MRLFFALWPDAAVASALAGVAGRCVRSLGGRATRAAALHMTLAFLGEQPRERLPEIIAAARAVSLTPFEMKLDRLAAWRHQRLLWAGCQSPPAALSELAGQLHARLRDAGITLGEAPSRSQLPFLPHVTLARKLPAQAFPLALQTSLAQHPLIWRCRDFVLLESRLSAAGAEYRVIETFGA